MFEFPELVLFILKNNELCICHLKCKTLAEKSFFLSFRNKFMMIFFYDELKAIAKAIEIFSS